MTKIFTDHWWLETHGVKTVPVKEIHRTPKWFKVSNCNPKPFTPEEKADLKALKESNRKWHKWHTRRKMMRVLVCGPMG